MGVIDDSAMKTEAAGVSNGDELPIVRGLQAFDTFYAAEFKAVAGLAYALSGSRVASEDLAQDAFLAAHRRWEEIGRFDDPGAWVRRAVANRSVSLFRRGVAEAKAIAKLSQPPEPLPELSAESADLWRAVRRLPRRQAQVVALVLGSPANTTISAAEGESIVPAEETPRTNTSSRKQ